MEILKQNRRIHKLINYLLMRSKFVEWVSKHARIIQLKIMTAKQYAELLLAALQWQNQIMLNEALMEIKIQTIQFPPLRLYTYMIWIHTRKKSGIFISFILPPKKGEDSCKYMTNSTDVKHASSKLRMPPNKYN